MTWPELKKQIDDYINTSYVNPDSVVVSWIDVNRDDGEEAENLCIKLDHYRGEWVLDVYQK